jgi:hypothetical protein
VFFLIDKADEQFIVWNHMNPRPGINLRRARKGLSVALALFVCLGASIAGAVAVSCENGGPCLNCMPTMHADGPHTADHMPVSQGCSSNMQGSACSFDNFDTVINRQIALSVTVIQPSELSLVPADIKIEPESAAAKRFDLALQLEPPGPTVPIYLKTLVFLC